MIADLRYVARVVGAVWHRPARPLRRVAATMLGVAALGLAAAYPSVPAASAAEPMRWTRTDALLVRAQQAGLALKRVEQVYDAELAPVEQVLLAYTDDRTLARRVSVALVREAKAAAVPPRLLLGVLLVENPWLKTGARSSVGAQGLMQVMPLHRGKWRPCAPRLDDIDGNICHGARIFASYLRQERGHVERALLRYNGCVKGTNTPNCHQYANVVFARAGRASLAGWRS